MPNPKRLVSWYLRRLCAMSSREIAHRIAEQARRMSWRQYGSGWTRFELGDGPLCTPTFIARSFKQAWPNDLVAVTRNAVPDVVSQRICLLGQDWPTLRHGYDHPDIWFIDPVTSGRWPGPECYCFDIDYRHQQELGDVKFVWEINRLQFLHPIAALAIRDNDAELSKFMLHVLNSWMRGNPPFRGVNWIIGIELAMRLVSLAFVVAASARLIDEGTRRRLRAFVAAHAFWLARFPSLFSSANNHRVAEGLGLILATRLVPDLPNAEKYLIDGQAVMEEAISSNFHGDGVGAEQSPTYTSLTLEMILLASETLREIQRPLSERALAGLARAARFQRLLLNSNGVAPRIGDDDDSHVVATPPFLEPRYSASILAAVAGHLGKPELAPAAREKHLRDLLFCSPHSGTPPADGMTHFAEGGYTIVREVKNGRRMHLVFDHGPLGFLSIAAHGHADALAIWLDLDGLPVFVDSGTYLFYDGGEWRSHFRSTASHNTLEVLDRSQSLPAGPFLWDHKARAWAAKLTPPPSWSVMGCHDGYRKRFWADHCRELRGTGEGITIVDTLVGAKRPLRVCLRFLIHPRLKAILADNAVAVCHGQEELLQVVPPHSFFTTLCRPDRKVPGAGWYSGGFGQLSSTTAIELAGLIRPGAVAQTAINISPRT